MTTISTPAPVVARVQQGVRSGLAGVSRLGVAFSGGVDSTALLHASAAVLGRDSVVAVVAVSPSLAHDELVLARALTDEIGVERVELATDETSSPAYQANDTDRCYHCKTALFDAIDAEVTSAHGLDAVAYGEIADDVGRTDRPGARAADEHRVLRPLATAGIDKLTVREYLHAVGLPNWDKPAAPCLASRIPHGAEVTVDKLGQVEAAEAGLRHLGFTELRVRHHGDVARIEVPAEMLPVLVSPAHRDNVLRVIRDAGFAHVTVDLAGLKSGFFARLAGS